MTSASAERLEAPGVQGFHQNAINLVALACIQLANALLPLVAYPMILGRIGSGPFSRVVVTESVMFVGLALVIFSFDVEGVSNIVGIRALHRRSELSCVFSEVLSARLVLVACCAVALACAAPFLDHLMLLLLTGWLLFPLSYALQSTWFFQGMEQNAVAAAVIVVSRVLSLLLLRRFIQAPADAVWIPTIIGGCYSAGGLVLLAYIRLHYHVQMQLAGKERVLASLARGRAIFAGAMSVALYRGANVLILNALSSSRAVAAYSIAEKIIKVFQAGAGPLNQVFFPKVIKALAGLTGPGKDAFRQVLRYTIPQLALLAGGITVLVLGYVGLHDRLPPAFHSDSSARILFLVAIMSGTVFFGIANFMFGTGGLNYLHRRAYYAKSVLLTGILNVVVCSLLVRFLADTGAAICFVTAEAFLFTRVVRVYFPDHEPVS